MAVTAPSLILLLLLCLSLAPRTSSSPDADAMRALAGSFRPLPAGWSAASDPCVTKWAGVTCSSSSRVTSISLPSLSISGTLPAAALASLSALRLLSLHHNLLSGPLPALPSPLPSLQELYLHDNNFTSLPASFLDAFPNLLNLSLDRNPFEPSPLPATFPPLLISLSASSAGLSGPIPASLGSMPSLSSLRLSYNSIVGPIPDSFRASSLRELALNSQDTKLSGPISVLAHMPHLESALLHSNNFSGAIPDLSNCTSLRELVLRDNRLTGPVPPSLAALPALRRVALSNNLLQGPFPALDPAVWEDARGGGGNSFCNARPGPCDPRVTALLDVAGGFGYPPLVAGSWKGDDPCANWLFVNCDPQGNVKILNFAGQRIRGMISPALAGLETLTKVILSGNDLVGVIPEELTKMPMLQLLDVSGNNLTGKMPVFDVKVEFKYADNPLLGKDADGTENSGGGEGDQSDSHSSHVWVAVVVVAIVAVVAGILGGLIYRRKRCSFQHEKMKSGKKNMHPGNEKIAAKADQQALHKAPVEHNAFCNRESGHGSCMVEAEAVAMPMHDLQRATGGFSEEKVLGRGGFGVVYKGELHDGTLIAVKRMECGHMGKKGMAEFHAEINVLTKVRHRHLVALLGYCVEGNERLLVYEYMAEGTLGQHLFAGAKTGHAHLTWKQRLVIALDVARGLEYLHNLAHRSFIHRDLKPSNILLDGDMRAKVSDFGLVKLAPDEQSVHTRLAGTFGYLAPEYATTGKVTTKIDVYAFGVVLMEMISGRKALDESLPDEHTHLVSWFRGVLSNKDYLLKAVDSSLNLNEEDFNSVITVAELAGHCTAREAHQRPDMGHAVNILAPLVDHWKPVSSNYGDSFTNIFFQQAGIIPASTTRSSSGL